VQVRVPKQKPSVYWSFSELSRRHGDFALAGLAALVEKDGERIAAARLVYFGCTDCAKVASSISQKLRGQALPLGDCDWLSDAIAAELKPVDTPGLKARTKVQLANAVTRRTLNDLHMT